MLALTGNVKDQQQTEKASQPCEDSSHSHSWQPCCCRIPAAAQEKALTIARQVSTTAMDPGFLREAATIVDNIFDTLVMRDKNMQLVPGLAESWAAINDTTWEFKLRSRCQIP